MKHQLLFILFFFMITISQAQEASSVIMYKYDQVNQQYLPQAKYNYDYDADDESRLRAYDKLDFSETDAAWIMSQQMVRDYNEHKHLVQSVWTNFENGTIKSSMDKTYDITYNAKGEIVQAIENRYNVLTNEEKSKELLAQLLKRVTDYRPLYNRYTPTYLAEHGFDLIYNEANQLIYGQLESCRLKEYHFSYGPSGRATQVEINGINSNGQMEHQRKVILVYEHAEESNLAQDVSISAFPNPTQKLVNIQLDQSSSKPQELLLTDLYGRLIRPVIVEAFQIETKIDVSDLAAGNYLLTAQSGGASLRLVKVD